MSVDKIEAGSVRIMQRRPQFFRPNYSCSDEGVGIRIAGAPYVSLRVRPLSCAISASRTAIIFRSEAFHCPPRGTAHVLDLVA